jgi:gas vesicle protein
MNINVSDKLIYFGAGCGVGLLLGALFAPSSGQETRQTLSNKVDDMTHKVQEKIQSSGIRDTANEAWQNVVEKGKNVASIGRQRFNESRDAALSRFNESIEDEGLTER